MACASFPHYAVGQGRQPQNFSSPTGAGTSKYGESVCVVNDTLVVGESRLTVGGSADQGVAHVYRWTTSSGPWALQQTLTTSTAQATARFGQSVAVSADTVVVGAPGEDGVASNTGAIYIYVRSGSSWPLQARIPVPVDTQANIAFGEHVAISGNTIVVGVENYNGPFGLDAGAAYVFKRTPGGSIWAFTQLITPPTVELNAGFARCVAIDGDTVLVGSPLRDLGTSDNVGAVYVYTRADSSAFFQFQRELRATDGLAFDWFGQSVSLSADTAAIGSINDDNGATSNTGSAYLFTRSGTAWTQQQRVFSPTSVINDNFGNSVSVSGNRLAVGVPHANGQSGDVSIFLRTGSVWALETTLPPTNAGNGASIGYSVWLAGDTVVMGAPSVSGVTSDAARVYHHVASTWLGAAAANPSSSVSPALDEVCSGATAMFRVQATGGAGLVRRWQHETAPSSNLWTDLADGPVAGNCHITGSGDATMQVFGVTPIAEGRYRCRVHSAGGIATSQPVRITIVAPPGVAQQPANAVSCGGAAVVFSATAASAPVTYRWQQENTSSPGTWYDINSGLNSDVNGNPLFVAVNPQTASMTVTPQQPFNAVNFLHFRVTIENGCFSVSDTASLRATTADFNGDGDIGTDADIEAFFRCLSGSCCAACPPDADFNGDGDIGTDADIESFFRVLAGASC